MTENRGRKDTEFARKLVVAAIGPGSIQRTLLDEITDLHKVLVEKRSDWTRRRVRALYDFEANKVHLAEIGDLLGVIRHRDEAEFQRYLAEMIDQFVGAAA
jgi:hypothetical protein